MLGVMLSLDATNSVNRWFLLHVSCRARAGTWGFSFRCGLFFLEVVFFLRSQSLFLKRCFFFFRFAADYFLESHPNFSHFRPFF